MLPLVAHQATTVDSFKAIVTVPRYRTNPLPDKNPLAVFTTLDKNPLAVLPPRTKTRSLYYHPGQKPARRQIPTSFNPNSQNK